METSLHLVEAVVLRILCVCSIHEGKANAFAAKPQPTGQLVRCQNNLSAKIDTRLRLNCLAAIILGLSERILSGHYDFVSSRRRLTMHM